MHVNSEKRFEIGGKEETNQIVKSSFRFSSETPRSKSQQEVRKAINIESRNLCSIKLFQLFYLCWLLLAVIFLLSCFMCFLNKPSTKGSR